MEEMKMQHYANDPEADAVILSDYGYSLISPGGNMGFYITFQREVRIKIFNKDAFNFANFVVDLHRSTNSTYKVDISGIKGYTYNLENNKIVKTKLEKESIFMEEINKSLKQCRISMPNIKEGCIIELKYSIVSDYLFYFPEWKFQYTIPVRYSQYITQIPEFLTYNNYGKGSISIKHENSMVTDFYKEEEYHAYNDVYESKNIPAFKIEPYITTPKNYMARMEYELATVNIPNGMYEHFSRSWEFVVESLLEDNYMGYQLEKLNTSDKTINEFGLNNKSLEEKLVYMHNKLVKQMSWNGRNSFFCNNPVDKAYKDGTGSSAEINIKFINMLRSIGLYAHPVVLSTRSNGILIANQPSISKLNYLIGYLKVGDREFLLDATDKNSPYYLIPEKCLNYRGLLVTKGKTSWVELIANQNSETASISELTLGTDGILKGTIKYERKKYAALNFRNLYKGATNKQGFVKKIEQDNPGLKIIDCELNNIDSIYSPVKDEYNVEIEGQVDIMGENMYIAPLLGDAMKENIFKLEERDYPVDFAYPIKKTYVKKISIPDGYKIEEKPENKAFLLPNNGGKYYFQLEVINDNQIIATSGFEINKSVFLPQEYKALKQFYDEIVKKESEKIVLKKL